MEIKASDGTMVDIEEVLEYRVGSVADTGKPRAWYVHGDAESVAGNFGIAYNDLQKAREDGDWDKEASAYADANNVDFKLLKGARKQANRKGGIKKSDYESLGRSVVAHMEAASAPQEDDGEDHETTLEWVKEQLPLLLASTEFIPLVRPAKPKKNVTATAKLDVAKERAREQGLSDEDIERIFGV